MIKKEVTLLFIFFSQHGDMECECQKSIGYCTIALKCEKNILKIFKTKMNECKKRDFSFEQIKMQKQFAASAYKEIKIEKCYFCVFLKNDRLELSVLKEKCVV